MSEDRIGETAAQAGFWHGARRKLGKLFRLSPHDRHHIEVLLAKRVPKPIAASQAAE